MLLFQLDVKKLDDLLHIFPEKIDGNDYKLNSLRVMLGVLGRHSTENGAKSQHSEDYNRKTSKSRCIKL